MRGSLGIATGRRPGPRRGWFPGAAVLLLLAAAGCRPGDGMGNGVRWREPLPGLEVAAVACADSLAGEAKVHLVRVDPHRFRITLRMASEDSVPTRWTTRQWCRREGAVAAVNAGMYGSDGLTGVGLLRKPGHVNNPRLGRQRMVLLLDPVGDADPPVRLVDLTCDDYASLAPRYRSQLQSIRMVGCRRRVVWKRGGRRHTVTAIGTDARGRVLLIHCGVPVDPHDLLERLLELPIGLQRVMYLEGGRPGQLCVETDAFARVYTGKLGGLEWPASPIPNVILVLPRGPRHD